jgi:hypothetical protein
MAIPAKPTLTTPPTAPVRGEDRASFATKANAYVVFIGTNVTDLTAAIDWQNTVFTAVESEAANAAQSVVDAAAEVVLAADQVALAADQVTLAEGQVALAADQVTLAAAQVVLAADEVALAADQVTLAEAAAAAAVTTANADEWVSGASYSVNANVISGIDFGTYRAILTHTGVATDPSADPTNWVKISAPAKASQAEAEAGTENTKFLTSLRTAQAIAEQSPSPAFESKLFYAVDEKTSGTNGAIASAGFNIRQLNTVKINLITGAAISSNRISLPSGSYYFEASAPAAIGPRLHRLSVYNFSDSDYEIFGSSELCDENSISNRSFVFGKITILSTKEFELRHYFKETGRLGSAVSDGNPEIYLQVKIWKVG